MDIIRTYSRRSLLRIIFFIGLLGILTDLALYLVLTTASDEVLKLFFSQAQARFPEAKALIERASVEIGFLKSAFLPIFTGCFLVVGLLLYFSLRGTVAKLLGEPGAIPPKSTEKHLDTIDKSLTDKEKKEKLKNDKRMFLHFISVLQREGRLLDFFSEDLDEYEDDQIGAAVRSIHENCKKVMDKYLTSGTVLDGEEDDEITIQPDFDLGAIKLTGNVAGDPPFRGVVRHRGWKAIKLDMPTLSGDRDPSIIAPAEVEIL
ncbi:MAG: hypothetical protein B6245_01760 [Desulfobacteraceae bacterium 4572_88]|nr:MAG: hypothetical protein B6245_01760 [Desulfobacteraceae bacterium 4572_88]